MFRCGLDQDDARYTSSNGERRIRVHTLATPVVNELSELYRAADVGAIVSLMSKLGKFFSLAARLMGHMYVLNGRCMLIRFDALYFLYFCWW